MTSALFPVMGRPHVGRTTNVISTTFPIRLRWFFYKGVMFSEEESEAIAMLSSMMSRAIKGKSS